MPGSFFDTNVLMYVASGDPAKADRAEKLIGGGGAISVQVLNEISNVARRKMGLSWQETHAFLALVRALLAVQPNTIEVHDTGLALAERYGLSIYDSTILAAALHADCDTLWSEDMQDGMAIGQTLSIVNPFRASGADGCPSTHSGAARFVHFADLPDPNDDQGLPPG